MASNIKQDQTIEELAAFAGCSVNEMRARLERRAQQEGARRNERHDRRMNGQVVTGRNYKELQEQQKAETKALKDEIKRLEGENKELKKEIKRFGKREEELQVAYRAMKRKAEKRFEALFKTAQRLRTLLKDHGITDFED